MHIYHHAYVNLIKVAFRCFKTILKSFPDVNNFHTVLDQLFSALTKGKPFLQVKKTAYLELDRVIVEFKIDLELN